MTSDIDDLIPLAADERACVDDGVVGSADEDIDIEGDVESIGVNGVAVRGNDAAVPCAGR